MSECFEGAFVHLAFGTDLVPASEFLAVAYRECRRNPQPRVAAVIVDGRIVVVTWGGVMSALRSPVPLGYVAQSEADLRLAVAPCSLKPVSPVAVDDDSVAEGIDRPARSSPPYTDREVAGIPHSREGGVITVFSFP